MNVLLNDPISILVNSAKLVIESDGRGTIQFTVLDQPVCLNIDSSDYIYDIEIAVNDRVRLIETYGALAMNSEGVVKEIIPDRTEDRVKVWFDVILPDQTLANVEAHVQSNAISVMDEVPLSKVEKI
jgi:hypothetical protein